MEELKKTIIIKCQVIVTMLFLGAFVFSTTTFLASCGEDNSDVISSCSSFGSLICSGNKLQECRGPGKEGGDEDGQGVVIEDCGSKGKICNEFAVISSCVTLEVYCAENVQPTPKECK